MTEPTIKMSKAALISLLQTRNEQLEAAEQTIERAMRYAFEAGYGAGHNDTVEGMFSLDEETMSEEWLADIKSEGTFQAAFNPPPPRS